MGRRFSFVSFVGNVLHKIKKNKMVTHNKRTPDAQSVASTTGTGGKSDAPVVSMNAGNLCSQGDFDFLFAANDSVMVVHGGRRSIQVENTALPSSRRATV